MDNLRMLYELVNAYARNEDYSDIFREIISPRIVNEIPTTINFNSILEIINMHNFNIEMFSIAHNEQYNTTGAVQDFLMRDGFDFNSDYLNFIKTYTQRGYFINFEVNQETDSNNLLIGIMTRFGYRGRVF